MSAGQGCLQRKGAVGFSYLHGKQGLITTPEPQGSTGAERSRAGVQLYPHAEKNTQELWAAHQIPREKSREKGWNH